MTCLLSRAEFRVAAEAELNDAQLEDSLRCTFAPSKPVTCRDLRDAEDQLAQLKIIHQQKVEFLSEAQASVAQAQSEVDDAVGGD